MCHIVVLLAKEIPKILLVARLIINGSRSKRNSKAFFFDAINKIINPVKLKEKLQKNMGKSKKFEILVFTPAWLLWKVAPKESDSELIIRDNFREVKGFKLIWKIYFQISKSNYVIEKKKLKKVVGEG